MVAPLKGVIRCGHYGCAMGPTYTRKTDRQYTYDICEKTPSGR
jgi:site-specific DNA recombinase